ncbi:hypothetical protein [Paraclostridium dentum]|uniref:hypothetical protein n=1 Tax=Paraclostridium dentum TaxID=2662455 RepID=UPI003F2E761E
MARLVITDGEGNEIKVNGKMTFEVVKVLNADNEVELRVEGKMTTHKYIEDIISIESDRYLLKEIEVVREVFGSNDYDILYEFLVDGDSWHVKEEHLCENAIYEIEAELYKDDESDEYNHKNYLYLNKTKEEVSQWN